MAEWIFRKKATNEDESNPGWDEYFTSNRSISESLVRESIQNSLDACQNKSPDEKQPPATVRIYFSGTAKALPKSTYSKYLDGATEHYLANACKIGAIPDGDCPYVTIEDFNTTGLTGNPRRDYSTSEKKPPYYRFFKCANQSDKGEGTRGKWGIGKVVFPIASRLRSFFACSIRDSYGPDEPREILCGKALLSYHAADDVCYAPEGWWGTRADGRDAPETDSDVISEFKNDFNLHRGDKPGLSVVVPYVKEIDWDEMKRILIENYMVSFVRGELCVELEHGDGETSIYDDKHLDDIENYLIALVARDASARMLLEAFKMVRQSQTSPVVLHLGLYEGECPEWQPRMFTDTTLGALRDELDKVDDDGLGRPVVISVPMRMTRKTKTAKNGEFKVVMRRSPGITSRPWFYREGLYINRVRPNTISNFVAVVLVDGAVSDMLNQAEPPSHSEWRVNTGDFKEIYKYPGQHIDFVVKAVRRIVDVVDETEAGLDYNALKSIFFVSREKSIASLKRGKGSGKGLGQGGAKETQDNGGAAGDDKPTDFSELTAKPKPYTLYPVKDGDDSGIAIKANPLPEFKPFELKVSFFYETLSGKVKFDENDFSFLRKGSLSVSWEPVDLTVEFPAANRLKIKVTDNTKNFKLVVRGFDANRDLRVLPHSEELKEADDGTEL